MASKISFNSYFLSNRSNQIFSKCFLNQTLFVLTIFILLAINQTVAQDSLPPEPTISARCDRGFMIISVLTSEPFAGIIHTRDYRQRQDCRVYGDGSHNTTLIISTVASKDDLNYCGVTRNKETNEDRSVIVAVRSHRELELSHDRYYSIACSQAFQTSQSKSRVTLKILQENGQATSRRLIHGNKYKFRVEISNLDPLYGLYVRNCLAFSNINSTEVQIVDANGCPSDESILEPFNYANATSSVETTIKSMFRFPDSNRVIIQCEVLLCRNGCDFDVDCDDSYIKYGATLKVRPDASSLQIYATATVYVVEPGDDILSYLKQEQCEISEFPWLLTLVAILGILLLIMLIVNIFLCTSLTCSCTKTEVVEKEDASELEDYDPYKIDWAANNNVPIHGSTYGSGSSLAKHLHDGNESDYRPYTVKRNYPSYPNYR